MRTPALIALAIAVFVVTWVLLTRETQAPPVTKPAVVAATPVVAPPAPTPVPAAPTTDATPAVPPPAPPPVETKPDPTLVPEPTPKAEETSAEPVPEPAAENTPAEPPADGAAPEGEPADEAKSSIDVDHAADLLADWMANQDAQATGDAEIPPGIEALKHFDEEEGDPAWSEKTEQQVEAALDQWLAGLPDEVRSHVDVIHVECRETLCQILAADNDMASQTERAQTSQEWQQAIATLPQQPWWAELGFVDLVTAVDNDEASGYLLYQTYLRREVKPTG